jgi:hypothetical protein
MTRAEAEARSERIRAGMQEWDRATVVGLLRGVPPAMLARDLLEVLTSLEPETDREAVDAVRHIIMLRVDAILGWPHGGYYADWADSADDELRALLHAQRGAE